jgi:hypothetical protein
MPPPPGAVAEEEAVRLLPAASATSECVGIWFASAVVVKPASREAQE